MNKIKWPHIFLAFLLLVLTTGCWDQREIEDIGIVLGLAIDKPTKGDQKLLMTHHLIVPQNMSGKKGGSNQKPYANLSIEGNTLFAPVRELTNRLGKPPSYEHLKIFTISEEIAQENDLRQFINFLLRNPESRRTVKVMISKGPAYKIFELKPPIINDPALKMLELNRNTKMTLTLAPDLNLGTVSAKLSGKTSFILQRIESFKNESTIASAAVISGKTGKMVGTLTSSEVEGVNWLLGKGQGKGGVVESLDDKRRERIVYEIRDLKTKIIPVIKDGKLSFTVNIKTEGSLREDWNLPGNSFDEKLIKVYEKDTERKIKETAQKALNKIQKNL
ncbi:MAG TPA: Ger(x)C family spore germination protein, partial [Bacillota bacterium]|nr:Ger(x)C family spore germination protein [Bacillota bacterium]